MDNIVLITTELLMLGKAGVTQLHFRVVLTYPCDPGELKFPAALELSTLRH